MNLKYQNFYLIKPAEDGTREDTKLAVEYSDEAIKEFLLNGYFLIDNEDFNLLIGNGDKEYCIAMNGTLYEKPPYVPTLEEERDKKLQELKDAYLADLNAPAWFEQDMEQPDGTSFKKYVGYDTDKDSQVDFHSSKERAKLLGATPYNIYVNPDNLKEKEFTYHTHAMFERALVAAGEYQVGVYTKYYTLKEKADNATTKEELAKINW